MNLYETGRPLGSLRIGEIDDISRATWPSHPYQRENELSILRQMFHRVLRRSRNKSDKDPSISDTNNVVNCWGNSGSGKSYVVNKWVREVETADQGRNCLAGYAKLGERNRTPLTFFRQIFGCLLERVLIDTREDTETWRKQIQEAVGTQMQSFLSLLSV